MVVATILYFLICEVTCENVTAGVLTHVIEVLPESLHPPMCFLSTLSGQGVRDLLTTVMVTDTDVLSFTVRIFL